MRRQEPAIGASARRQRPRRVAFGAAFFGLAMAYDVELLDLRSPSQGVPPPVKWRAASC
jgi:hypothetical protein